MSSSTLQHPSHRNGFSPSRSERTRTLDSTGEFASPPPPITTTTHVNGHASGSRDGSSSITVDPHPQPGPSNGVYNPEPPKPEKKRKKKGWKGWALVVEDDHGNILEINDGPEPDPLPSRRGRVGREVVTAPVASVEPIPPPVVVTKTKSPSPHIDGQTTRGSAPPAMGIATSPKKSGGFWKQRKLPVPEPASQPPAPSRPAQAERVNKRVRRYSFSASSVSPAPSEPVPKTANPPAPRHSLPKVKPAPKIARPGPSRSQPNRGDTQPSTARATPINTPDDRPTKPPRDDTTAKPSRATRLLDQSSPLGSEIRNEASLILASAAKHREDNPLLSSPDDELTPASSTRLVRPMSPNTGRPEARIRNTSADEDEASEHGEDFDTALEKVKQAYRNGIRPCNNPYAPQERSVPVHGLEDANPPEWLDDQPPMIVPAPRRDRALPTDPAGRAHREGFEGLSEELAIDADGFLENVKGNLSNILTYYLPQPGPHRDAFVERIGRGLVDLGWQLTDSSVAALTPRPLLPLPPPGPSNE